MNEKEFVVNKIRSAYMEKEMTQLETLKELDKKVRRPANVFAVVYGSISAIIMGSGMSLVMTDIGNMIGLTGTNNQMIIGITVGIVGLALALSTYPIYKAILSSRQKKYKDQILKLTDDLLQ